MWALKSRPLEASEFMLRLSAGTGFLNNGTGTSVDAKHQSEKIFPTTRWLWPMASLARCSIKSNSSILMIKLPMPFGAHRSFRSSEFSKILYQVFLGNLAVKRDGVQYVVEGPAGDLVMSGDCYGMAPGRCCLFQANVAAALTFNFITQAGKEFYKLFRRYNRRSRRHASTEFPSR